MNNNPLLATPKYPSSFEDGEPPVIAEGPSSREDGESPGRGGGKGVVRLLDPSSFEDGESPGRGEGHGVVRLLDPSSFEDGESPGRGEGRGVVRLLDPSSFEDGESPELNVLGFLFDVGVTTTGGVFLFLNLFLLFRRIGGGEPSGLMVFLALDMVLGWREETKMNDKNNTCEDGWLVMIK